MGAKTFRDLRAWQQSDALKRAVYGLTNRSSVSADRWFSEQTRRAAASVPANIAEGFGRFQHADFVRFLRIALGSLDELEQHLRDGVDRGHFQATDIEAALVLKRHTTGATVALIRYLRKTKAP
jgi:four helix bundle protein